MGGLEAADRLGHGVVVHAALRGRSGGGILDGQPIAQRQDLLSAGAAAHAAMVPQPLPTALGGDGLVGGQGLEQGPVAGIGGRLLGQPVGDLVGALGRQQSRGGVVAGRADAPFLGELGGRQTEAVLGPGVLEDRSAQRLLAFGLRGRVGGRDLRGDLVHIAEGAGREALGLGLRQRLQHGLAFAGRERRAGRGGRGRRGRALGRGGLRAGLTGALSATLAAVLAAGG